MTQPIGSFLTDLRRINGQPVLPCGFACDTHNCDRPCGRLIGHPSDDGWGCICDGCAQALTGVQL